MPAPYPWDRLERVEKRFVPLIARAARRVPPLAISDLGERLSAIFGETSMAGNWLHVCAPGRLAESLSDPLVGVVLVGPAQQKLVLELAPDLALAWIDVLLGAELVPPTASGPLSDVERGVVLYAATRLLDGLSWRAAAVVTSPLPVVAALRDEGSAVWSTQMRVGVTTGVARVWIPDRVPAETTPPNLKRLRLTVCADAGAAELGAEDLASLRPGDVVVLDECWWRQNERIRVRVLGASRTSWWLEEQFEGWFLHSIEAGEALPEHKGGVMSDEVGTDAGQEVVTQVGDAPIALSVEVARFTLAVEELAALRPGEVVTTSQRVGDRVSLRAGQQVVAEGELVDVDGEIGIRILSLAT